MKITLHQYVEALYDTLHEAKDKDHDKIIANFIEVLKSNGDIGKYEQIIEQYEIYDRKQRNVKQVEMITAHETTATKEMLTQLNKIVGTNIEVKQKIDQSLIGGVVLKVDDTLIDGSIKRHLSNLKDSLVNN